MIRPSSKPWRLALLACTMALLGAACAPDQATGTTATGDTGGEALAGSIAISGSSTVEPISVAVAEKFNAENPNVEVSVQGPGTSDGFELFCNGETDISDASRAISQEEIDACKKNGIEAVELRVAIDGLSVVTSTENDFAQCLSFGDLWALLGPEAEGFEQWSDANELAAQYDSQAAPFPDQPLRVTAPGEESGTYGSFIELVFEPFVEEQGLKEYEEEVAPRPDYQASANDNVIVEGVSGTPSSLGWVGYAFYKANEDKLKALEVDGGNGCVAPTPQAIASFEYPISRPLFIYVNKQKLEENPATQAFVDFYLSDEGIASAEEVGYIPLEESELEATRTTWESQEVITEAAS
ncbi:MAG: PstS family phosphate ABC transporter substrate-binding protein [Actinomycetota bacterium]|nr:PstS family phosphate ABC transporter substrate-binding protein [Actinomycetota bacterium]